MFSASWKVPQQSHPIRAQLRMVIGSRLNYKLCQEDFFKANLRRREGVYLPNPNQSSTLLIPSYLTLDISATDN